jgi:hypothetical protein
MSVNLMLWIHLQAALLLFWPLRALVALADARRRRWPLAIAGGSAALAFVPIGGSDLAGLLYAFSGQLSVSSLLLLTLPMGRPALLPSAERRRLFFSIGALSLAFYPATLGLSASDPYAWGFGQPALPGMVLVVAAVAWWRGYRALATILAVAVWSWLLQLGESNNLWDYLLDAWLALYALVYSLAQGFTRRRRATRPITNQTKANR